MQTAAVGTSEAEIADRCCWNKRGRDCRPLLLEQARQGLQTAAVGISETGRQTLRKPVSGKMFGWESEEYNCPWRDLRMKRQVFI